jgi:hypothetical protein
VGRSHLPGDEVVHLRQIQLAQGMCQTQPGVHEDQSVEQANETHGWLGCASCLNAITSMQMHVEWGPLA